MANLQCTAVLTLLACLCYMPTSRSHGRVKRYITFPEGSTFSFAFCMEIKAVTPDDPDIFTEAVAVATSYDLPNNSMTLGITRERHHVLARSHRSYIYSRIALVLDRIGLAGQECVLRALCEGTQHLQPRQDILSEIIRTILKFPEVAVSTEEPATQWTYLKAYKAGLAGLHCAALYPECPVSLVGMALSLRPRR